MMLPFFDRNKELGRLEGLVNRNEGTFGVLYGRRRCGKSRLLREALASRPSVYYVGDDREAALQRAALAVEIGRLVAGFDEVTYPEWNALLGRWWREAPTGAVLVLDELPSMVASAPELPSLIQKYVDAGALCAVHLLVAGSSQRMMHGLVLDRAAPLYGRADEILEIRPLPAGWIMDALSIEDPVEAVKAFAHWGGVPRYWELARNHGGLREATRHLVLDPLGVLYEEPMALLLDDLRDTTQAASILSLIGRGCHRVSEIAGRLGKPATSIGRPLQRLMATGLVERELPFGAPERGSKRTLYRIADPFLAFWFRFVEPNRSRLEAGLVDAVEEDVINGVAHHVASTWEDLARRSVPGFEIGGRRWGVARRWWGSGLDRRPVEVDLVAESLDGESLLVGEVKWTAPADIRRLQYELERRIDRLPFAQSRDVVTALWLPEDGGHRGQPTVVTPRQVLEVLR